MKVLEEPITVLCAAERAELTLLMGGYRVALTTDEARTLLRSVGAALQSIAPDGADGASEPAETIAAKVAEQVISWAQIAAATERK